MKKLFALIVAIVIILCSCINETNITDPVITNPTDNPTVTPVTPNINPNINPTDQGSGGSETGGGTSRIAIPYFIEEEVKEDGNLYVTVISNSDDIVISYKLEGGTNNEYKEPIKITEETNVTITAYDKKNASQEKIEYTFSPNNYRYIINFEHDNYHTIKGVISPNKADTFAWSKSKDSTYQMMSNNGVKFATFDDYRPRDRRTIYFQRNNSNNTEDIFYLESLTVDSKRAVVYDKTYVDNDTIKIKLYNYCNHDKKNPEAGTIDGIYYSINKNDVPTYKSTKYDGEELTLSLTSKFSNC